MMTPGRNGMIIAGAVFGLLAVILGAFGAHTLEGSLGPGQLDSYETAVRYQFYHALGLVLLAVLHGQDQRRFLPAAAVLFIVGTILFSGSIYLLSTRAVTGLHWNWLGPVTPIGGLCLITGWMILLFGYLRMPKKP